MTIQAMDSSHVTLVELRMKECFTRFECPRDELISLNLETLSKILKLCDNDAALELSTKGNKLIVTSCRDSRRMQFQQILLDIDMSRFDVPEMTYQFRFACLLPTYSTDARHERVWRFLSRSGTEFTFGTC